MNPNEILDLVYEHNLGGATEQQAVELVEAALGQASAAVPACEWSPDGDDQEMPDTWDGSCGARWTFTEGGPAENTMNFCPQCGGRVHVAASQPEVQS